MYSSLYQTQSPFFSRPSALNHHTYNSNILSI